MANFYKKQRIKNKILVDDDKPIGGKWSFDEENRKKLPKEIDLPKRFLPIRTKHTEDLKDLIEKFSSHPETQKIFGHALQEMMCKKI